MWSICLILAHEDQPISPLLTQMMLQSWRCQFYTSLSLPFSTDGHPLFPKGPVWSPFNQLPNVQHKCRHILSRHVVFRPRGSLRLPTSTPTLCEKASSETCRTNNRDAQITHFCHRVLHYRVIWDAYLGASPISIHWRRVKLERVSHYKTHLRRALRVCVTDLIAD
jgi:hypothetical protein